ncbi:MAG: beta-L-arabinofuranosidase domain-containing protein [Verrucomicrobiota bacterium]
MKSVPHTAVAINDKFWAPRRQTNRTQTLDAQYRQLRDTGTLNLFRHGAKPAKPFFPFLDSDLAKWIEAASYSLATHPDAKLAQRLDEVVDLVISAQQPDGYLNT